MEGNYRIIEKIINYLDANVKRQPDLEELARVAGLSKFHFQRIFKEWAGISPKKFLEVLTVEYTKELLNKEGTPTTSAYDAGLSSSSRLHEHFVNIEAVTPAEYKSLGSNLIIYYGVCESRFGSVFIAVTERGICALYFVDSNKNKFIKLLQKEWPEAKLIEDQDRIKKYFELIFNPKDSNTPINLYLKGTNFQIQVWKALLTIPKHHLKTYADIAEQLKKPKAVRAVGTAVGHNSVALLIPCHRVINKLGIVGNYRWGKTRKKAIIAWESLTE